MNTYFFKQALLPDGWHENIRVEVDDKGMFSNITKQTSPQNLDTVLDCVIPSMPNCHSHVFQRTMAGLTEFKTSEHDSFWSWRDLMYRYANQIDADQLYHIACYVYSEMLQSGYSSVCEFHYIHRDLSDKNNLDNMSTAIINAAHEVGIALTLLPVLYTQAHIDGTALSELQQRFKMTTQDYIDFYRFLEKKLFPEQNLGICFHSLRAVSIEQMKTVLQELDHGQPIHIHIAEQEAEIEQVSNHTGKRPVELLFRHFNVNHQWCLIHATHLNEVEIKLIADSKAIAGICPLTEANLGDGVFPLRDFLQQNGSIAIGSDSHILINPFQEIQMFEYSQRLHHRQRIVASTQQVQNVGTFLWNQSIFGGTQACQLPLLGISLGQKANWISLDTQHPLLTKLNGAALLDSFVFASNKMELKIYINGQKQGKMNDNITQNYKNTLKSLR